MTGGVLLFPGQGVQRPGMADGLDADEVFGIASDVLGVDVAELCRTGRSGPADLASTRWAQPAVLCASLASGRRVGDVDAVCGHSLGEFAALVRAGSIDAADGVQLVALRGRAMEEAASASPGGMAAVLRLGPDAVAGICADAGAVVAGDNAPGQLVVSGPDDALDRAQALVVERGGKWSRLDVAGAFHSPALEAAVPILVDALASIEIREPVLPVWSPTVVGPLASPESVRAALVAQLTGPVRFRETIEALLEDGASRFVDAGPGTVLAGLVRRIDRGVDVNGAADVVAGTTTGGRR